MYTQQLLPRALAAAAVAEGEQREGLLATGLPVGAMPPMAKAGKAREKVKAREVEKVRWAVVALPLRPAAGALGRRLTLASLRLDPGSRPCLLPLSHHRPKKRPA